MRDLYASRLDCLVRSVRTGLTGLLEMSPLRGGLQVVGWLPPGMSDVEAWKAAGEHGVDSCPLSLLSIERTLPGGLVLGVASAGDRAIRRGVERLGQALRELQR